MGDIHDENNTYYNDLGWVYKNGTWQDNKRERDAYAALGNAAPNPAAGTPGAPAYIPQTAANSGNTPTAGGVTTGFNVSPGLADNGPAGADWLNQLKAFADQISGRQAQQLNAGQSDQMRAAQTGLITDLQNQAAGVGPSLAQAQLSKASDQNLANTMATIQSTRGMGATAAAGQAQGAGAQAGQQLAQDSAILRLQEQMQAKGLLGQLATGTRGQDIGVAGQNAQLAAQNDQQIADLRAKLLIDGQLSYIEADRQARLQVASMNQQGQIAATGARQGQQQIDNQKAQADRAQTQKETEATLNFFMNFLKSMASAGGGAAGAGAVTGK